MSGTTACPGLDELRRLPYGGLTPAEADALERHVEGCPACAARLADLLDAATLPGPTRSYHEPQDVKTLLSRLRAAPPPEGRPAAAAAPEAGADACAYLTPPEAPGEIGRLGGYRVVAVLGRGGMGVVLRAFDPALGREVAVKIMRPDLAGDPAARERFLREARAAAALRNDHVVTIYHVGEAETHGQKVPFLVMELLPGESLERRLRRERVLPTAEVVRIGREAALALKAAHALGLVHRDVKPDNIWLEGEPGASATGGRVKLLDFGLARLGDGDAVTRSGAVLGTPAYMAPEQADGKRVDARADLFSLGVVLYRCLTGVNPFERGELMATLSALATVDPQPPHKVCPDVPAKLSKTVGRLLARDPEKRTPSAEALLAELGDGETMPGSSRRAAPRKRRAPAEFGPKQKKVVAGFFLVGCGLPLLIFGVLAATAGRGCSGGYATKAAGGPGRPDSLRDDEKGLALVTHADVLSAIAADLKKTPVDVRPRHRYLTTAHLLNNHARRGESLPALDAAFRALNDVLRGPDGPPPFTPLGAAPAAVYRLDLGAIAWDRLEGKRQGPRPAVEEDALAVGEVCWRALLKSYPYGLDQALADDAGVKREALRVEALLDDAKVRGLVHVRADWFVWATSGNVPMDGLRLPRQADTAALRNLAVEHVDLKNAAAELAVDSYRLAKLLTDDADLRRRFGLKDLLDDGVLSRKAWSSRQEGVSPFQGCARKLGLGVPLDSK
jgi:hypothetical protein